MFQLTSGLDSDDWHELRASGTTHIVSTSGLHVLIAGFALLFLLTKSDLPRPLQIVLLLVCLLLYGGAAGLRPPIIRAIVMIGVALSAYLFRKGVDLISAPLTCRLDHSDPVSVDGIQHRVPAFNGGSFEFNTVWRRRAPKL